MDWSARVLVIVDGDLASAVGCAAAAEAAVSMHGPERADVPAPIAFFPGWLDEPRVAAAEIQARANRMKVVRGVAPRVGQGRQVSGVDESIALVEACGVATAEGCSQVLWATCVGGAEPRVEDVATRIDKAALAGRLAACDRVEGVDAAVRVESPYADLSDEQLATLARDLGVHARQAWWWGSDGPGAAVRARWVKVFEALGSPVGV